MLTPDDRRYTLQLEGDGSPDLAARLDDALRANPHYSHCRSLGQLNAACVRLLRAGAYERYTQRLTGEGMRLGDIKPVPLDGRTDWDRWL